jgi:hypothetical protein
VKLPDPGRLNCWKVIGSSPNVGNGLKRSLCLVGSVVRRGLVSAHKERKKMGRGGPGNFENDGAAEHPD